MKRRKDCVQKPFLTRPAVHLRQGYAGLIHTFFDSLQVCGFVTSAMAVGAISASMATEVVSQEDGPRK